jgi:hypothetical protein
VRERERERERGFGLGFGLVNLFIYFSIKGYMGYSKQISRKFYKFFFCIFLKLYVSLFSKIKVGSKREREREGGTGK